MLKPIKALLAKLPPMPTPPPTHEPRRSTLLQLALLIFIASLLHFKIADPRIAIFALIIFAVKATIIARKLTPPPKTIMMILTIASLGMVIYIYGGWNGRTAGISFIVLLVSLKFLESNALRDYFIVCLLLYFLAASSFLFDSSMVSISIIVFYTLGITSILFQISNPAPVSVIETLKSSAAMVAKALPLAVLLFFFFPRISGDFGFLPSQDKGETDGLSDSLVAGEMAASAFDNSLAFRAEFRDGIIPPRSQLYWRAKTMSNEVKFTWEVAPPATTSDFVVELNLGNGDWFYEILHEKSRDKYLPYLDYVNGISRGKVFRDYSVSKRRANPGTFSYKGSASNAPYLDQVLFPSRTQLLATDTQPSAKLQALITQWREGAQNDQQKVARVYQWFIDGRFSYSLTPQGLDEFSPLEDFLLNTREGYCEHYASAFTTLMRWLGVPARVVVGYQGGTSVNGGQYLEVRYSDAHAWTEVWIKGQWQRVDPTATVSPERIEYGMEAIQELWGGDFFSSNRTGKALVDFLNPSRSARLLRSLQDTWKAAGYQWNKWVVNYDIDTQRELLEKLGFQHRNSIVTLVVIMMSGAMTLMLFYFWQLIPKRIKRSELQAVYLRFVARFDRYGITKEGSDTPKEFAQKAGGEFPEHLDQINAITAQYQTLRYNDLKPETAADITKFKQMVKQFKISPNKNSKYKK